MIGRVTTISIQPGKMDDVVALEEAKVGERSIMKQVPGLCSYTAMVDFEKNLLVVVSLWESQGVMEAALVSDAYRQVMAPLVPLLGGAPISVGYDVAAIWPSA
jgi:quinol monooxygenase YgiN